MRFSIFQASFPFSPLFSNRIRPPPPGLISPLGRLEITPNLRLVFFFPPPPNPTAPLPFSIDIYSRLFLRKRFVPNLCFFFLFSTLFKDYDHFHQVILIPYVPLRPMSDRLPRYGSDATFFFVYLFLNGVSPIKWWEADTPPCLVLLLTSPGRIFRPAGGVDLSIFLQPRNFVDD